MSLLFEAHDQPETARFDYWQDVVGSMLCPLELRTGDRRDVPDRLLVGDVGPVRVAELTATRPGGAERTPGLVRRSDADLCKIDVQVRGHGVVEQDDRQAVLAPGDFTFVDLSRPARWSNASTQVIAVMFPRALLPLRADDLRRLTGVRLRGDRGAGALVSTLARRLPAFLDDGQGTHDARLSGGLLDLLAAALATRLDREPQLPAESRQRALLLRIRAFIDQHLSDPRLTPRSIAAAHYVSLRYLHKVFEPEQHTVADWIRHRRLELCRQDLRNPLLADRPVSAIAARHGLPNAAHFGRAFRNAYGIPPAEYRRLALHGANR